MKLRWNDPVALYLLAIFGVLLALLPDELRLASAWALPIWAVLLYPWPGYRFENSDPTWQKTHSAEMFIITVLTVVWLFGILGTSALLEEGPEWVARASAVAILELGEKPSEARILQISPTDFTQKVYVGAPKEKYLNVSPADLVFSRAAEDYLKEVPALAKYSFILVLTLGCAVLMVVGSVRFVSV